MKNKIVNCKDCDFFVERELGDGSTRCVCGNPNKGMSAGVELKPNDFCSYGVKKEAAQSSVDEDEMTIKDAYEIFSGKRGDYFCFECLQSCEKCEYYKAKKVITEWLSKMF